MSATALQYFFSRSLSGILLFAAASATLTANAEGPDTLNVAPFLTPDSLPSFMNPQQSTGLPQQSTGLPQSAPLPSMSEALLDDGRVHDLQPYHFSFPENPILAAWRGGALTASGASVNMPGLMGIESGRLSLGQKFGPLTLTAWAEANKYGYFRGLQTSYGFGGQIDYQINDRWSITAFGQYYSPIHPLTPAMAGYMATSNFGGYASYNINDRWGISVGAQATRSLVTNRWEAQPIVMPYYRVNKKVSIGIDVGGIIYNLAKDYISNDNSFGGNAGSAPIPRGVPRPTPPRVAPRH